MDPAKLNQLLAMAERFDTSRLAAQVEQATLAADKLLAEVPQFDTSRLAAQVEQATLAADKLLAEVPQFDASRLAAQVEQATLATGRLLAEMPQLDASRLTAQVGQATLATGGLLAEMPQLNASRLAAQVEQATLVTGRLLAAIPRLTPELFGGAWNERVAEAVARLERTEEFGEDMVGAVADPRRAVGALAEDAATVQEAAPAEAQERVNTRLSWLRVRRGLALLKEFYAWVTMMSGILTFLGVQVPAVPTAQKLLPTVQELLGATPPDRPPVSRPDLPATREIKPATTALALPGSLAEGLPALVQRAGPAAAERVVEFFTEQIHNANTRAAYAMAVTQFFSWCDERGLELDEVSRVAVVAYVEELQGVYRAPTVKQHLAAIRRLFDWLVLGQVVPWNPAATVRGPTHVGKTGKTRVLQPGEVRLLLDSIDTSVIGGLRDRALLGVMIYSFARVSAVVNMDVGDYYQQGERWRLRLHGKGQKRHTMPVHPKAGAYLDVYLEAAAIVADRASPLWRTLTRTRELGERRMSRVDVFRMVKRRVKAAGLGDAANCHTFRASGITAYLLNGGTLERAQAIAGHESPRTTQLYDRTADVITVEDIERIKM